MKRLFILCIIFFTALHISYAETWKTESWTTTQSGTVETWMPEKATPPISHLEEKSKIKYIYYYGEGCGYCTELDYYLKQTDGYNKLDITKKEVWSNKEHALEMTQKAKELWVERVGVPFIVVKNGDKEAPIVSLDRILEHFKPILWEPVSWKKSQKTLIVLVALFVLAIIVPTILIKLSSKK